jgi:hypothetical protein
VFVDASGHLTGDVDNLSWRYTNSSLRLGAGVNIRWHHLAELRSPATGVLECSGEDHDVSNQFDRIALGLDDSSHPALRRNGVGLEARKGGAGGALTTFACSTLTATTVNADTSGTTASYTTVNATTVNATNFNRTGAAAYTASNVTTDRVYDADATTLDEIADVLGTLLADLHTYGIVG